MVTTYIVFAWAKLVQQHTLFSSRSRYIDKITAFLKISSSFQVDSKGFSVSDLSTKNPKRTGVKGFLTKNST